MHTAAAPPAPWLVQGAQGAQQATDTLRSDVSRVQDHVHQLAIACQKESNERMSLSREMTREVQVLQTRLDELARDYYADTTLREAGKMELVADARQDLQSSDDQSGGTGGVVHVGEDVYQAIKENADELKSWSGCVEELSAATIKTTQELRLELETMRQALEANDDRIRAGLLDTIETTNRQLLQSISDEQGSRVAEANLLRMKFEAVYVRLDDMRQIIDETLSSMQSLSAADSSVPPEKLESLRIELDSARAELSKSVASNKDAQSSITIDARRHAEEVVSNVRKQMSEALAEERKACVADVETLRRQFEESLLQLRLSSGEGASVGESGDASQPAGALPTAAGASLRDLQDLRAEVSTLRATIQVVDSECRRSAAAASRAEAEMLSLEGEARKSAAVLPRVEALEEQCRKQSSVARKLEAIEGEVRQAVREPEMRRMEAEMRRTMNDVLPLAARIDAVEAEVRMAHRESSPILTRLELVESELQVVRDNVGAAGSDPLKSEMAELKQCLMGLMAGLGGDISSPPRSRGDVSPARSRYGGDSAASGRRQRGLQPSAGIGRLGDVALVEAQTPSDAPPVISAVPTGNQGLRSPFADVPPSISDAKSSPTVEADSKDGILPSLSTDLKNTIESLVHKVNKTLAKPGEVGEQERVMHMAVQALREQNLFLREGNAEIAQELLQNEGLLTPPSGGLNENAGRTTPITGAVAKPPSLGGGLQPAPQFGTSSIGKLPAARMMPFPAGGPSSPTVLKQDSQVIKQATVLPGSTVGDASAASSVRTVGTVTAAVSSNATAAVGIGSMRIAPAVVRAAPTK